MSTGTRWASFLLLPAVGLFEGGAWYAMRSVLATHLLEGGGSTAELGTFMTVLLVVGLAGTLLAALLALPVGPSAPLLLGSGIALVGIALLLVVPGEAALVPAAIAAFGHGVVRPTLWGAGARAFRAQHENLRVVVLVALYGAANLAGFSSAAAGELRTTGGATVVFGLAAASAFVAVLLAIGLVAVLLVNRRRDAEASARPDVPRLLSAVALTVVIGIVWGTTTLAWEIPYTFADPFAGPVDVVAVGHANQLTVIVSSVLVAALFGILHLTRTRFPWLVAVGLGLVVSASSMTLLLLQDTAAPSAAAVLAAAVLLGVAEILVMPLLLARVAGDLPWRLETAVVTVWLVLVSLPSLLGVSSEPELVRTAAWVGSILLWPLGLAVAVAAFPLRRVFTVPREPAESAAAST